MAYSTEESLRDAVGEIGWFHSIDLGGGVVTPGLSEGQLADDLLPSFEGKTVLDIGAWDGYYSFQAERHGATRVVAVDHYAWGVDMVARGAYWNECAATGVLPDQERDLTEFWRDDLPGRQGFELAAAVLDSTVEPVVADFATADLTPLGTFDVVLYLGVLYHMKEPLTCLERLRSVTAEVAVIETQAVHLQGLEDDALMQFYAGDELNHDFGNWYVPNMTGLHSLCRAAGFRRIETVMGGPEPVVPTPPPVEPPAPAVAPRLRDRLRGQPEPTSPPEPEPEPVAESAPSCFHRALVHAWV